MWLRGASGSGGLQQDIVGGVGGGREERRPVGEGGVLLEETGAGEGIGCMCRERAYLG